MKKTNEEIIKEIIAIGLEIESCLHCARFPDQGDISRQRRNLISKGRRRIKKLESLGVDVEELSYEDEDLEYAIQFI